MNGKTTVENIYRLIVLTSFDSNWCINTPALLIAMFLTVSNLPT